MTPVTTQQAYPKRAAWRTVVQNIISAVFVLGVALPVVATIVGEQLGQFIPDNVVGVLVGAGALMAAVSGALARIMAIPVVDKWLRRLGLSSDPEV